MEYLNRPEQSAFLSERGLRVSPKYLQKLATVGGGPRYVLFGGRALSKPEWLLEWAESRMSEPRTSTSDAA